MKDWLLRLLNLPPEASSASVGIDHLHYFVILTTMVSSTVVFLVAAWFTIRYRRRSDADKTPRVSASTLHELVNIGGILGLFVLFWIIGYRQYADLRTPPPDAMTIYVTGKQWMWKFSYASGESTIATLTVPVGRPVRLVMTSRDVIHSFYVPAFRLKQDVLPGRYTTLWFRAIAPGEYDIDCAEYCGLSHSNMRGKVVVLSEDDYAKWVEKTSPQRDAQTDLARQGYDVAAKKACLSCHTLDGQPHVGPTWAQLYGSWVKLDDGRVVLADEAYLTRSMMDPGAEVVDGFKPVMPTYKGLLTEPETAAVVELIRSLRDHPPDAKAPLLPPVQTPPASLDWDRAHDAGAPPLNDGGEPR